MSRPTAIMGQLEYKKIGENHQLISISIVSMLAC